MRYRVAVIGAGSWGTTVASLAATNAPTTLWCRRAELATTINTDHVNVDYLPGFDLPGELRATSDLAEAISTADVVVMAVPSHGFREVIAGVAEHIRPWVPIVSLSKGLEHGSLKRMSEVVNDELPGHPVAVLTGPNLAAEVMAGHPAASVVAIDDDVIARALQRIFSTMRLLVYRNPDLVGCEVAGVMKNVIALAAGMVDGLGFGENTKATLITRGLAEMTRFGVALGGQPMTFAGLAGMGDLIATCSSSRSRNHTVGFQLGRGRSLSEIVGEMKMVAEGVKSCASVLALAERTGLEMPITAEVVSVVHDERPVADALASLMARGTGREFAGM